MPQGWGEQWAPCPFPRSPRSDLSPRALLYSCASLGGPQGPGCLEPLPHWSDFGMDESCSDSPAEPAEPLGGPQEGQ